MTSYPAIEQHAVVGDRRTAALVASDGTINWWCAPRYDSPSVFGSLLDDEHGGFWRLGPAGTEPGEQRYLGDTAVVVTRWSDSAAEVELTDLMPWPMDVRSADVEHRHALVRRLCCTRGEATCVLELQPRFDFALPFSLTADEHHVLIQTPETGITFWASCDVEVANGGISATIHLHEGEEVCTVVEYGVKTSPWSPDEVDRLYRATLEYWQSWADTLDYHGPHRARACRSALTVHLLSYAPSGSMVAAPTTSLPERIGGDRNYDYRFAWVRDASLSMAVLALLGDTEAAQRYMDWLAGLDSATESPLQVMYQIDGGTDLSQRERTDIAGYRDSQPVRFGNHAALQRQLDSLGYLADCAFIYLSHGGPWNDSYWELIRRSADYTVANWHQPDSGIWELSDNQHYVSSKVMSWVTLERSIRIAHETGNDDATHGWRDTMDQIHAEVMDRGWSDRLGAFRQRYEGDNLDASALLIPVMGFLPPDHPRVHSTVRAIEETLTINGFVHRFIAAETPGQGDLPLGAFEGAFLPCSFWLATTYAMMGRLGDAEQILVAAEQVAGGLGLFAEEIDAQNRYFLGNTPLLFSHVEYVRALIEIGKHTAA